MPLFFCVGCAWHAGWKLNATQSNATYDGWCVFHFYLSLFSRKVAKGSRSVEERMNEYIMKPSPESEEHKIYCQDEFEIIYRPLSRPTPHTRIV